MNSPLYIRFSDDGAHIRRWSREPFEGGRRYDPQDDEFVTIKREVME